MMTKTHRSMKKYGIKYNTLNLYRIKRNGDTYVYLLPKGFMPQCEDDILLNGILVSINGYHYPYSNIYAYYAYEFYYTRMNYRYLDPLRFFKFLNSIPYEIIQNAKELEAGQCGR